MEGVSGFFDMRKNQKQIEKRKAELAAEGQIGYNVVRHYTCAGSRPTKREDKFRSEPCASPRGSMSGGHGIMGDKVQAAGDDHDKQPAGEWEIAVRRAQMGGDYEISHISGGAQSPGGGDQCR